MPKEAKRKTKETKQKRKKGKLPSPSLSPPLLTSRPECPEARTVGVHVLRQ
jgi:hypothetical protein